MDISAGNRRAKEGKESHTDSPPVSPGASKGSSRGRLFCEVDNCGKSFSRREHLDRHSWNHRDCPDITCMICRAHFKRRDLLDRHIRRHAERDREAGGPGMGRLVTRKRCWLDHDGKVTTSRPTTPSAAAAWSSMGPQEGGIQDLSSGEDAACGAGGHSETGGSGPKSPHSCMGSPSRDGERSTCNERPEPVGNGAPSQFQQQSDPQGEGEFADESFQHSPQAYGMDALMFDTAGMSLGEYQGCYSEPFGTYTVSDFDMPFTTLESYSPPFETPPGYLLGDQGQDVAIEAEPAYATDVAGSGGLLELPAGEGSLGLGLGVRGPTMQHQTFLYQVLQSLRDALEKNEAFPGERGVHQCNSCFSPPEVAQELSLGIPPVGSRAGTIARPNTPDFGSLWVPPAPHTQYPVVSPTTTLGYTQFDECASTPTSPSPPFPTNFIPPLPRIDEITRREVLSFITRITSNSATGEPGPSWDDPLVSISAFQNYLDLFFSRSNPSCPLLHQPSFDPSSVDTLLLLSVLMLGATYGGKEAHQLAVRVHDGLRGSLVGSVGFFDPMPTGTRANPYGTARREDMIYVLLISMLRPGYTGTRNGPVD